MSSSSNETSDKSNFLNELSSYTPTVPHAVIQYELSKCGINIEDPKILHLISIATDRFLAEIIYETKQLSIMRAKNMKGKSKRKAEEITDTMQLEDLSRSLKKRRVSLRTRTTGMLK
mmetsp:Transcript_26636/g.39570  ORF Transcript_26636/g.39570 Transcript_26636/m.39570 type:complete len:117 (-) Transcript_26636:118-468(-)